MGYICVAPGRAESRKANSGRRSQKAKQDSLDGTHLRCAGWAERQESGRGDAGASSASRLTPRAARPVQPGGTACLGPGQPALGPAEGRTRGLRRLAMRPASPAPPAPSRGQGRLSQMCPIQKNPA